MTQFNIEHFYHGKLFDNGIVRSDYMVTACSKGLTQQESQAIFDKHWLFNNPNISYEELNEGVALLNHDERYSLLTYVTKGKFLERGHAYPSFHCWLIPKQVLSAKLQGNIAYLLQITMDPPKIYEENTPDYLLPAKSISPIPLTQAEEISHLNYLFHISQLGKGQNNELPASEPIPIESNITDTLVILSRILGDQSGSEKSIVIVPEARLKESVDTGKIELIKAFVMLIPPSLRHEISFTTEVFDTSSSTAMIKFVDSVKVQRKIDDRIVYFGQSLRLPAASMRALSSLHPYVIFLNHFWNFGPSTLHEAIKVIGNNLSRLDSSINYLSVSAKLRLATTIYLLNEDSLTIEIDSQSLARVLVSDINDKKLIEKGTALLLSKIKMDESQFIFDELVNAREDFDTQYGKVTSEILKLYFKDYFFLIPVDRTDITSFSMIRGLRKWIKRRQNSKKLIELNNKLNWLLSKLLSIIDDERVNKEFTEIISAITPLAENNTVAATWLLMMLLLHTEKGIENKYKVLLSNYKIQEQIDFYLADLSSSLKLIPNNYNLFRTLELTLSYIFAENDTNIMDNLLVPAYELATGDKLDKRPIIEDLVSTYIDQVFYEVGEVYESLIAAEVSFPNQAILSYLIQVNLITLVIRKGKQKKNLCKYLLNSETFIKLVNEAFTNTFIATHFTYIIQIIGIKNLEENVNPNLLRQMMQLIEKKKSIHP